MHDQSAHCPDQLALLWLAMFIQHQDEHIHDCWIMRETLSTPGTSNMYVSALGFHLCCKTDSEKSFLNTIDLDSYTVRSLAAYTRSVDVLKYLLDSNDTQI